MRFEILGRWTFRGSGDFSSPTVSDALLIEAPFLPVEKVCHWLCQCRLKSASSGNSALAKPVAHLELSESVVFQQAS